jgi:hypothetical protein
MPLSRSLGRKFDALETEIARGKRERRAEKSTERKPSAARKSR